MARNPSRLRGEGVGCEAYGLAENPGGDHQGVRGGVKFLQGIDNPRVDELPWEDETPGVATKGKLVMGEK